MWSAKFPITFKLIAAVYVALALAATTRADDSGAFKRAIEQFNQQDYAGSRDALKALVKASPRNPIYQFNLANAYMMLGDYATAARCYNTVTLLKSALTPAALLYKSKALRSMGRGNEARGILEALATSPKTPKGISEQAKLALNEITANAEPWGIQDEALTLYRSGRYREAANLIASSRSQNENLLALKDLALSRMSAANGRALSAYVDLSTGYTDNAYVEPDTYTDKKKAATGRALWGAGYRFWQKEDLSFSGTYSGSWDEVQSAGDLKALSNGLALVFGRQTDVNLFQLSLFAEHEAWANEPTIARTGARIHFRWGTDESDFGTQVSFAKQSALDTDRGYLAGNLTEGRIYAGTLMTPVYGQVFLFAQRQETGDQSYSDGSVRPYQFSGWGGGARFIWRLQQQWTLAAQATYEVDKYPTLELPDAKNREDSIVIASLKLTRALRKDLAAYVSASQRLTKSTLGPSDSFDENNSVSNAFIGVSWDLQ